MNVPPVGVGPPNLPASLRPTGVQSPAGLGTTIPGVVAVTQDNLATLLELLAIPDMGELFSAIDQRLSPQSPAPVEQLLVEARAAVAAGDDTLALAKVKEFLIASPHQTDAAGSDPALRSIRPEVLNVVRMLTAEAKIDAESKLGAATQAIASGGPRSIPNSQVDLAVVFTVATHFFDSGRLLDYVRAGELAQFVTVQYAPVAGTARAMKATKAKTVPRARGQIMERVNTLWKRAPLLVLLLAWLALGVIGGVFALVFGGSRPELGIWGLGFLALVGFGFYARIRNKSQAKPPTS